MGFPRGALREKQNIIDGYLNDTGRDLFVPAEFLDWLRDNEGHPCYGLFFGRDDADLAWEYRKDMVRNWVSGLRLRIRVEHKPTDKSKTVKVTEREWPAMISPSSLRRNGGGYYGVNLDDPDHLDELSRQAAASLESWLERNGGIAEMKGCDLAMIKETVGLLRCYARVSTAA